MIQRHASEKADPEQNVTAFLRLIRYAENNKDSSSVYNTLYGGGTFSSYKTHPNKEGTSRWGKTSHAAGAYQFQYSTWDEARGNGVVSDFSPASQDKLARYKLEKRGALEFVRRGDIENAISRLTNEWTSLPGGKESKMTMHQAHALFGQFLCDEMYGVKKIMKLMRKLSFQVLLLLTASPVFSVNTITNHKTGTLICGNSILTAQTTYLDNSNYSGDQVAEQKVTWRNVKTNQQKEIKTDGKYVIKHMPERRRVLDAAIDLWGCIKSKQGKYYFRIDYYCTSGEEKGFCAQGRVEWVRILNEDGSHVIKDSRHWHIKPSYIKIYKSLGLYEAIENTDMEDVYK